MINSFDLMAEKIAKAQLEYEMEKVEATSKEITEMLFIFDFITDSFMDKKFLSELVTIKFTLIISKNLFNLIMQTISLFEFIALLFGGILIYTLAKTIWQELTQYKNK